MSNLCSERFASLDLVCLSRPIFNRLCRRGMLLEIARLITDVMVVGSAHRQARASPTTKQKHGPVVYSRLQSHSRCS